METATAIAVGVLSLVIGSIAKVIMDWEDIRPGAPIHRRARALFRQFYLGPDFVLLAIGLLISFKGLQALLAANNVTSKLGDQLGFWFTLLILSYFGILLLLILLWLLAGDSKYIPIEQKQQSAYDVNGRQVVRTVQSVSLLKGFKSKAGLMTLVSGNSLGLLCLGFFVLFVAKAF
jgi:hypothetical protein